MKCEIKKINQGLIQGFEYGFDFGIFLLFKSENFDFIFITSMSDFQPKLWIIEVRGFPFYYYEEGENLGRINASWFCEALQNEAFVEHNYCEFGKLLCIQVTPKDLINNPGFCNVSARHFLKLGGGYEPIDLYQMMKDDNMIWECSTKDHTNIWIPAAFAEMLLVDFLDADVDVKMEALRTVLDSFEKQFGKKQNKQ